MLLSFAPPPVPFPQKTITKTCLEQGVKFLFLPIFVLLPFFSYFLRVLVGAWKHFEIFEIKLSIKLINATKKLLQADQEASELDTNQQIDHYWNAVFLLKSIDGISWYQSLP